MKFGVSFPGRMKVNVHHRGHTVQTDQPLASGGGDTAMAPFDLFLGSIVSCGALYARRFCEQRGIATDGLDLTLEAIRAPESHRVVMIRLELTLPDGFPQKYRDAIVRAIDHCSVKRHIVEPPKFDIVVTTPALVG